MKVKILSLAALSAVLLSCGSSRTTTTASTTTSHEARVTVPTGIQTTFTAQYPGAVNVIWTPYDQVAAPIDLEMSGWAPINTGDYVARFDMNGLKYYSWYDANGDWIGTAYVVNDPSALPQAVRDVINTRYSGYAIESIQREMKNGSNAYEIKLKKTDNDKVKVLVDDNGGILKEKLKG